MRRAPDLLAQNLRRALHGHAPPTGTELSPRQLSKTVARRTVHGYARSLDGRQSDLREFLSVSRARRAAVRSDRGSFTALS